MLKRDHWDLVDHEEFSLSLTLLDPDNIMS